VSYDANISSVVDICFYFYSSMADAATCYSQESSILEWQGLENRAPPGKATTFLYQELHHLMKLMGEMLELFIDAVAYTVGVYRAYYSTSWSLNG
jgi:hypothetical protein